MAFVVLLYQHPSQTKHKKNYFASYFSFTELVGYFSFIIWGSMALFLNVCSSLLFILKRFCFSSLSSSPFNSCFPATLQKLWMILWVGYECFVSFEAIEIPSVFVFRFEDPPLWSVTHIWSFLFFLSLFFIVEQVALLLLID